MKLNSTFSDLFPQNINLKKKKSQDSFIFPNKYIDRKLNATSIMSKNNNIIDQADIN